MKNNYLIRVLFSSILACISSFAQTSEKTDSTLVISNLHFVETPPLSELMEAYPTRDMDDISMMTEAKDKNRKWQNPIIKSNPNALPLDEDPAIQKEPGTKSAIIPIQNWQGMNGSGFPPDPTGAAGPNHFVQAINTAFRVYNKNGTPAGNQTGLGVLLFGVNDGDPIVMYDKFADRWFISQFGVSANMAYIAVSKTSDPLGQYYAYDFQCNVFPDYLKFSIWQDGYYMTANFFGSQRVFCFERDAMIAGNANARAVSKTYSPPRTNGFFCPLTASADGQLPPAGTPCPLLSYEDDGWGTAYDDQINLYEVAVTWGSTPTMNITLKNAINVQPFDASYNANWNDISQPGTSAKLDGIGGVLTFRAQYRKWDGYNSMVLCHAVKVNSSGQFGIRWYEIRQIVTSGNWLVHQQGTYAPDGLNRWVGSIAMDDNGNIGMAYAVSGTAGGQSVYPSIRYTGRQANDPLGMMTIYEQEAFAGTASQTATNRFGDYSHTSLDPDGITFWHTGEYIGGSGTNGVPRTRIFSFQIPGILGLKNEISAANWNTWSDNGTLYIRAEGIKTDGEMHLQLFDIQGKKLLESRVEIVGGAVSATLPVANFVSGTYLLSASKPMTALQKVSKIVLTK